MPYLFDAALEAHEHGTPVMRAMPLEFPDDPGCDTLDRQYMLGGSLLVAPIFSPDGKVDYYLPEGRWTNFLSNDVVEGGRWVREMHGYLSLPLMVRPNSIIAVGANEQKPDYDFADGVTFHIFELADNATVSARVPTLKGETALTVTARREGREIRVDVEDAAKPWSLVLRNVAAVQAVEGGAVQVEAQGVRIIPDIKTGTITIQL